MVIGAGPAGNVAAMSTAGRGIKTLILEKEKLPRFKLCGGAVPNWVVNHLNIPEEVLLREYNIASFFMPPNYERQDNKLGNMKYFGVNRDTFDYSLTKMAIEKGAELKEASKVKFVIKDNGQVKGVVTSTGEKYFADVVIACDGVMSMIAKKCGLWTKWFSIKGVKWQDYMAACIGIELQLDEETIDNQFGNSFMFFTGTDFAPNGYAWLFPKRKSVTIGLGSIFRSLNKKPTDYLQCLVKKFQFISNLIKSGTVTRTRGAWIPIGTPYKPTYDAGLLIAGDSAGMVSPIAGEGIVYAIRAGMDAGNTAAEAVIEENFSAEFLSRFQDRWGLSIDIPLIFQKHTYHSSKLDLKFPCFNLQNKDMNTTKLN